MVLFILLVFMCISVCRLWMWIWFVVGVLCSGLVLMLVSVLCVLCMFCWFL